jgi:shikimate kinase
MPGKNKIYIIGFMGSGKTTAGRKLATLMGWNFIDLDKKIEDKTGISISEIFADQGEKTFREMESEMLQSLENFENAIISTGGGAPCFNDNMDFMVRTGITIYLKLTPPQLMSRLISSSTVRPLIRNLQGDDLLKFIEKNLSLREKHYNRAEITFSGFELDVKVLRDRVWPLL